MKKNGVKKIIMVLVAFAVAGLGANAFAGCGGNCGQGQRGDCPVYDGELGEDKIQELDQERKAFYEATESLRQSMDEKSAEISNELAKETSDVERLSELQKEVSDLRSQFGQKRLEHIIKMKEINPNFSRKAQEWNCGGYGRGNRGGNRSGRGNRGGCLR